MAIPLVGARPPLRGHRLETTNTEENTMQLAKWIVCAAGVAAALGGASAAHGQSVTFSDINDAVPGRFFDGATSAPDVSNPNRLRIGLNTGVEFETFKLADFKASSEAFSHTAAMDTIGFRVTAPAGFYISKISYSQQGGGTVVRTGRAAGMTNWVVDEVAADLGQFATDPSLSGTFDLTDLFLTSVPVSITNSLFAFSTPALGSAEVALTSAEVLVELLPCPPGGCTVDPRSPRARPRKPVQSEPPQAAPVLRWPMQGWLPWFPR